MTKVFLRNTSNDNRYQVLKVDKEKGELTLQGKHSVFTEPMDTERLKKLGYVLEKE